MRSWHRNSDDVSLKDGTTQRVYNLVFNTDNKELAKEIEKYFESVMDRGRIPTQKSALKFIYLTQNCVRNVLQRVKRNKMHLNQ